MHLEVLHLAAACHNRYTSSRLHTTCSPFSPARPTALQVSSHEEGPYICVWDTRVGSQQGEPELMRRDFKKEDRGFCALAFSPDGVFLTAVATDNSHTVYIIDWRRNKIDGSGKGQMGDPPQVRAAVCKCCKFFPRSVWLGVHA